MPTLEFEEIQDFLEEKLEQRPSKHCLIDRNILKEELDQEIANSIQAIQQRLKFKRRVIQLNKRLKRRPEYSALFGSNILKDLGVSPSLYSSQQSLKFKTSCFILERKLRHRPLALDLIQSNIMKAGCEVAPNLQSTQQNLKFKTIVSTLDHKLERRPSSQDLIDHNIIEANGVILRSRKKSFSDAVAQLQPQLEQRPRLMDLVHHNILKESIGFVAPSLQATQLILSRCLNNNRLNVKLELRPSKGQIRDHTPILKDSYVSTTVDRLNWLHVRDCLGGKIVHRPDVSVLVLQKVLPIET